MTYNNESNLVTVDKIIVLMEEISVLKSRFKDHDTGHLQTAVTDVINDQNVALKVTLGVLESRVQELRERISD